MTLAKILIFCVASTGPSMWSASPQAASTDGSTSGTGTVKQETATQTQTPTEAAPEAPKAPTSRQGSPQAKTAHKTARKKKLASGCVNAPPQATNTTASSASNAGEPNATPEQKPGTQASTNCPPPKIIVRQGGTSEPSIQLAGGPKPQPAEARATTAPMLEATEENLKKLAGRQLSDTQKDMVIQIQQFIEQSKSAGEAGDVERARTLAWKAQTLSEDLASPAK